MSEVSQGFLNRLTAKRAEVPAAEAMLTRAEVPAAEAMLTRARVFLLDSTLMARVAVREMPLDSA